MKIYLQLAKIILVDTKILIICGALPIVHSSHTAIAIWHFSPHIVQDLKCNKGKIYDK